MSDIPQKHCVKCGEGKPATTEFFHRNKRLKDGLNPYCKTCVNKYMKAYDGSPERKKQRKVYLSLPETRNKIRVYRQRPEVRVKQYALMRDWRKTHPEPQERLRERHRKWDRANRAYRRKWRHEHPERRRIGGANYRALRKAVSGGHTAAQIQDVLKHQRYRCYYAACGHAKFQKIKGKYVYHIEHTFPLSRVSGTDIPANDISYLVLACPSCNLSKHDKFPWEWPEGGRLL